MAVQIVENWSKVTGTVSDYKSSTEVNGFTVVEIVVEQVDIVEGFPSLLRGVIGNILSIHVPDNLVRELGITIGDKIVWWVRQAGLNRFFVHRDHIIIEHE